MGRDVHEAFRVGGVEKFQSTRPRGARRNKRGHRYGLYCVSIHAPAWGATFRAIWKVYYDASFNPRARVGRDSGGVPRLNTSRVFQSTRPRGARLGAGRFWVIDIRFQSTRPRGARLIKKTIERAKIEVSIHAPAWGATESFSNCRIGTTVSIHAPAWGATYPTFYIIQYNRVSIHAPAWGATKFSSPFNPYGLVSIHAPAWGATHYLQNMLHYYIVSIHAPAWGATQLSGRPRLMHCVSIHAPAWGATYCDPVRARPGRGFQSTRPRGARPTRYRMAYMTREVSIHAPAWGATQERHSA